MLIGMTRIRAGGVHPSGFTASRGRQSRPFATASATHRPSKPKPQPEDCPLCGTQRQPGHDSSKRHLTNSVIASLLSPDLLKGGSASIQKVREAIGLGKRPTELTPKQQAEAASCATIASSGIALRRFRALGRLHSAVPSDICTDAERRMAASLIRMDRTGLAATHFRRTDGADALHSGWCTPEQLARAQQHRLDCTERLQDSGLEPSRFRALGIDIDTCTLAELAEAADLINARLQGDVPISFLRKELFLGSWGEDEDEDVPEEEEEEDMLEEEEEYKDEEERAKRLEPEPIWVSKKDYEEASEAYEQDCINRMSWAEICDVPFHPWDNE